MSDTNTKDTIDAIRKNPVVAALEKRLTVDANEELVNLYNQAAKPSYTLTETCEADVGGIKKSITTTRIKDDEQNRAWQSDFFTTTRFTASCFLNPFASKKDDADAAENKSENADDKVTKPNSLSFLLNPFVSKKDDADTAENKSESNDDEVMKPKPLTLAFESFHEFTDDVKALFFKPTILTLLGAWHAARFAFKMVEIIVHLMVAGLDWLNLEVKKNQCDPTKPDHQAVSASIDKARESLSQDLKNAGEAALDLVESAIKMMVYPFLVGYELPAQIVSIAARSIFSYQNISKADVAEVVTDGVDQVKEAAGHIDGSFNA
ncbi:MAG: hypothetical protein P1U36_08115 [Legionellaceae bacterium]|nr:hypothetical protein [Legionellaceae bacterium]